jgi:3-phenylpropionate/trans-cinnamate dioxygenase ferredoxin reductase subunit
MRKVCKVTLNGEAFLANCGEVLLDSALLNGVELQHDCRSGICGSCRVRLVDGQVFGGTEEDSDMIYACQARIVSDLNLVTEPVPDTVSLPARVAELTRLAPDVIGVNLELPRPLEYLPGQYCKLQFRGFPERSYSPSYPLEGAPDRHRLQFHIRRFADGTVSSALGRDICVGHRVRLTGPLGSAHFRADHQGRIVLVASGTGFAPMWSIAAAAITEQPRRELMFVVAARKIQSFYMHAALCRLALFPNVTIIPIVSEPQSVSPAIRGGRPLDHLPPLIRSDVVYAAGAPIMTKAVARLAQAAGSTCYTDPFVSTSAPTETANLMERVVDWLDRPRKHAATRKHAKTLERSTVAS